MDEKLSAGSVIRHQHQLTLHVIIIIAELKSRDPSYKKWFSLVGRLQERGRAVW